MSLENRCYKQLNFFLCIVLEQTMLVTTHTHTFICIIHYITISQSQRRTRITRSYDISYISFTKSYLGQVLEKTFNIGYIGQFWNEVAIAHPKQPGGRLNIKMPSYQYRYSHVKDKTVSPTVLSLTWESQYMGKTVFILRQGPADRPLANIFRWSKWKCHCYKLTILETCMGNHWGKTLNLPVIFSDISSTKTTQEKSVRWVFYHPKFLKTSPQPLFTKWCKYSVDVPCVLWAPRILILSSAIWPSTFIKRVIGYNVERCRKTD